MSGKPYFRRLSTMGITFVVLLSPSTTAFAQHTTCMSMGPNMMTCDTIGGGTTSSAPSSDGGAALGAGLGALIAQGRERSFNKKVGALLAAGDCDGAARFALEKGRLDLGRQLLAECQARPSQPQPVAGTALNITPGNLAGFIQQTARSVKTPVISDDGSKITDVRGIGARLQITTTLKPGQATVPLDELTQVSKDTCATAVTQAIVRAGGSVNVIMQDSAGKKVAEVLTTQRECRI